MEITGTVTYVELEGGFWGIIGDTGKRYALGDFPEGERWRDQHVRATVRRVSGVSVRMWGVEVDVVSIAPFISAAPSEPST